MIWNVRGIGILRISGLLVLLSLVLGFCAVGSRVGGSSCVERRSEIVWMEYIVVAFADYYMIGGNVAQWHEPFLFFFHYAFVRSLKL